jgi:sialic acid synthase SpsE
MNTPIYVVAEIAQGYEGSEKLVEYFIKAASKANADAIKFHIFYADELALPDYRYYDLFKKLELPFSQWAEAIKMSHKYGLKFYSEILGIESLAMLNKIGADGYKIHATDINNLRLLKEVAKTKKEVFLSTGGCDLVEIDRAVEIFQDNNLVIMHGFQAEPTLPKNNYLNKLKFLKERYHKAIGFQDHTSGIDKFSAVIPFIAIGLGATVIEKHLTLSRVAEMEDCVSAMTPEEFVAWVKLVKKAHVCMGKEKWGVTKIEKEYRFKVKRAVCSMRGIEAEQIILEKDITLKRTGDTNAIFDMDEVIGKKAIKLIKANTVIREDMII